MSTAEAAAPEYVPETLVMKGIVDDYTTVKEDPFVSAACFYDGPELMWSSNIVQGRGGWFPTRHALIEEIFLNTELFSSDRASLAPLGVTWKLNPVEYDAPEHQVFRMLLNPLFSPKEMAALNESISATCDELIDQFADKGHCEFTRDFGEQFPSYIFLDLLGMPRDKLQDFLTWERQLIHGEDIMENLKGMQSVMAYVGQFAQEQKANPTTALWKTLYEARIFDEKRPLTDDEVMGIAFLLYVAGLDTVFSTMGWVMRHLAMHPEIQQRLRDNPNEIPKAVDEYLRAYSVATPERTVTRDTEFHGVQLKAGDRMFVPTYLAGRDPAAYENPDKVDLDRNARHLALATGPHACLGMHLARRELRTVIEKFLARFKNIRIPEGEQYQYKVGGVMTVTYLPLEWDPV